MANDKIKISELAETTEVFDGCCLPIVTNGETRKVKYKTIRDRVVEEARNAIDIDGAIMEHDADSSSHGDIRTTLSTYGRRIENAEEIVNRLNDGKMEYYIINFDGSHLKHNGDVLTFAQIREKCLDDKHFVYVLYDSNMYIPQMVSTTNIFFDASYIRSDTPQMHRIRINNQENIHVQDMNLVKDGDAIVDEVARQGVGELKEDLSSLEINTSSGIPEYKSVVFSYDGQLNKNGEKIVAKNACSDFIKVSKGQHLSAYLQQDTYFLFAMCLYTEADQTTFFKGVNFSSESYRWIEAEYTFETDCFVRICSVDTEAEHRAMAFISNGVKSNSKAFAEVFSLIGETDTKYIDVTSDIFANSSEGYLGSGGVFLAYNGAICSDYIEVKPNDTFIYQTYTLYDNYNVCLYDADKRLIRRKCRGKSVFVKEELTIPPTVKYIRICSFNSISQPQYFVKKAVSKSITEMLEENTDNLISNPIKYADVTGERSAGYLIDNGSTNPSGTGYATSDYIDITKYDWFKCRVSYGWEARGYVIFNEDKIKLFSLSSASGKNEIVRLNTADILAEYPSAKYIRFCGDSSGKETLTVYANELTTDASKTFKDVAQCGNVLYGKKIAFCGDSFTEASNLGDEYYDKFQSCYKSYGWMIATRNAMNLFHDGKSGSTMHIVNADNPSERSPFSYQRYKDVPKDCDYILLQFGLNESGLANSDETKGTKNSTDCTTMWGSWNTVLEYLITECPTARIGVVMSDAWMPQNYYTTLKEICEWWGVPMLDLGGDPNVPLMNSGRRIGSGLTVNPKVVQLRNNTFYTDPTTGDSHPNYKGHVWRSTVIENFIRSL